MPDDGSSRADMLSDPRPPAYRAIIIAGSGTVINAWRITADNDEQATNQAKALVDGHAVELWDGLRFIEHFPAVD